MFLWRTPEGSWQCEPAFGGLVLRVTRRGSRPSEAGAFVPARGIMGLLAVGLRHQVSARSVKPVNKLTDEMRRTPIASTKAFQSNRNGHTRRGYLTASPGWPDG